MATFSPLDLPETTEIRSPARRVTSPVCPKIGGVPLEVVEAGALRGEDAFESFVVEDDFIYVKWEGQIRCVVGGRCRRPWENRLGSISSSRLSDVVVSLVDPYPKADFVPVLGEEAGIVVPKEFDNLMLVPNPPRPVFGTGKDHRHLKG